MTGYGPGGDSGAQQPNLPDEAEARAALVLGLRQRGIAPVEILSAIERLPRRLFLAARHHKLAYEDIALPMECGQTMSAPSDVAFALQALDVKPDHLILEVGTGSGYQTAVLAQLARHVYSLERYQTLLKLADQRLAAMKQDNVTLLHEDGLSGLEKKAPFDRIILNGAVTEIPDQLMAQLAPEGILIAPLGQPGSVQSLVRLIKTESVGATKTLGEVRMISLMRGVAHHL
ncbi:protein-L-isoaspartate(D-aspartate) O-methyltransferase [Labrenzia sp. PHM005]|uniref:protein-L-isoaspartate(D-aspartate) O-methyltransferase n=1 Tax=Stappiaceae TaxID=2821832 RepID=UPI0011405186|nr:protein-L-isoaspartate(D-aspartate) O-methyltransferase [Labrenzia sp. PHM005]QDG77570.1 protein-L-isoaspartate(D-aspartate) O-methyltransferase [Labrenzia sp. PHM005]